MVRWIKPIRVNGRPAWVKAVTVVAGTPSGEDKVYAHFGNVVHDKDRPFVVSVEPETERNPSGIIQAYTGWNHVKLDFWTKGNEIFFSQVTE